MGKSNWKHCGDRDDFAKEYCCWWDNHGGGAKFKRLERQKSRTKYKRGLRRLIIEEIN